MHRTRLRERERDKERANGLSTKQLDNSAARRYDNQTQHALSQLFARVRERARLRLPLSSHRASR